VPQPAPARVREPAVTDPATVTAAVARNLRAFRSRSGWTLDALAARSGVSKGMLIAIEQARSNPSIATLCRIADAFGVVLARLVEVRESSAIRVVPPEGTVTLWRGEHGSSATLLVGSDPPQHLELWDWRMQPGEGYSGEPHPLGSREMVWVLDGELTLDVGGEAATVPTGGAALFLADRPHSYTNAGSVELRFAMAVTQPPLADSGPPYPTPPEPSPPDAGTS
jgi:transcriptional regulator with XRE-family HTH domain